MANQVKLEYGTIRVLDDSILDAYNESIKSYNSKIARECLGKFDRSNGELTGSSPLMIIQLINAGLLPKGTKLASRDDLENAISKDNSFLRENYTDFALALRTAGDSFVPNDVLAKRLANQLKQRDIALGNGKLIPFDALSLTEDENSAYGLVINLKDRAESPIRELNDYKWDYIRNEGLSCAGLCGDSDWDSSYVYLAISVADGRVVVCGEATPQNFQQDDLMQKVRSALDAGKSFEYQGTLYVPVSDKDVRVAK